MRHTPFRNSCASTASLKFLSKTFKSWATFFPDRPRTAAEVLDHTSTIVRTVKICCVLVFTGLFVSRVVDSHCRLQKVSCSKGVTKKVLM